MSREIKFRAFDKAQNKMLSHEELDQLDKKGVVHFMDIIKPDNKDGLDVMQYTGLHDKNGKEIYDGDVVTLFTDSLCEVVFKRGGFGYMYYGEFQPFSNHNHFEKLMKYITVKGNIHENPELLNK